MNAPRLLVSRCLVPILATAALCGLAAPAAVADTTTSSNWSGYVVHRSGVRFKRVISKWRIPAVTCSSGQTAYSASWVGIGGYSATSNALEQTGTESDCSNGRPVYYAWYEMVPAASQRISATKMPVRPGNLMRGEVDVVGHTATLKLVNETQHKSYSTVRTASSIDTTSAEWILEAPSLCDQYGNCATLPLADFGRTSFVSSSATNLSGHTGAITSPLWGTTKVILAPGGPQYIVTGSTPSDAGAMPSAVNSVGAGFSITYEPHAVAQGSYFSSRAARLSGPTKLVHPLAQH